MSDNSLFAANGPPAREQKPGFRFDNRFLAPILITGILIVGWWKFGIVQNHRAPLLKEWTGGWITTYSPTFVAILVAIGMELFLGKLLTGKWPHLASAYISGISVGILVRSTEVLWPYILCSLISIVSKYAIRFRGRHLWNPSNLGVSVLLFLAPAEVASLGQQWGNNLWPMAIIWCLGSLILWRLGRLHISVTYAIAFIILSGVRSAITGDRWLAEVAPLTGPMYSLFVFFMITDPKTTTKRKWSQCAVAVLVAVVETVLRLRQEQHAPYYALFIVGPITNFIEILWDSRRKAVRPVVTPAAVSEATSLNGTTASASADVPGTAAVSAAVSGSRSP
jgi:Na+-translocating ferredoxin:NAD+ oxidoreductase RnfD subunit